MKVVFKTPGSYRVCFDRVIHVDDKAVEDETVYDIPAEAGIAIIEADKAVKAKVEKSADADNASNKAESAGDDVGSKDSVAENKAIVENEPIDSTAKKSKGFFGNK